MKKLSILTAIGSLACAAVLHAGSWTSAHVPSQVQTYRSALTPTHLGVVTLNGTTSVCDLSLAYC